MFECYSLYNAFILHGCYTRTFVEFHHNHHHHKKKWLQTTAGAPANAIQLLLLILYYNITTIVIIPRASSEHYNISYESLVLPQEVDISFQTVPGKTIQKISLRTRTLSIALCLGLSLSPLYNTMCITPQLLATFPGKFTMQPACRPRLRLIAFVSCVCLLPVVVAAASATVVLITNASVMLSSFFLVKLIQGQNAMHSKISP